MKTGPGAGKHRLTGQQITALLLTGLLFWATGNARAQVLPGTQADEPEATPTSQSIIKTGAELPSDTEIRNRLQAIFANLSELSAVSIDVEDGVVILGGSVEDNEARVKAEALANRIAGAVIVVNDIERDRSVMSRMRSATRDIKTQFRELLAHSPLLLLAAFVVAVAVFLARLAGRSEWLLQHVPSNWLLQDLARQLIQLVIVFLGLLAALSLLDATAVLGSVVGALGLLGLAIGFATRDTVENYIASILLSIRQPFRHEEYVRIDEVEGKVIRLTSRATVLMSLDGNHLRLPNAKVFKATIVNFTRNPLRRFEFTVGVDTDLDLQEPRQLALETLASLSGVLENPSPACLVDALGDSSVILRVQGWIDQRDSDFQKTRSEAQRLVKEAFDDAGVVMPEPIYNINLRQPKEKQVAAAPLPGAPKPQAQSAKGTVDSEEDADTRPDRAVDQQIRADRQSDSSDVDLLDRNAPSE